MTGIRHFTASAIVLDDHQQVLLVHHNKLGQWVHPGGHIDPNEDPAQAAQREVLEETGLHTEIITDPLFTHPAVTTHAPPYTIIELAPQLDEVGAVHWVPLADPEALETPAELPALVTEAAQWAKARWPIDPV